MSDHIAPNCFERDPVWVPATRDQALAMMGRTKVEQDAARAIYVKQIGAPVKVEQRRKVA